VQQTEPNRFVNYHEKCYKIFFTSVTSHAAQLLPLSHFVTLHLTPSPPSPSGVTYFLNGPYSNFVKFGGELRWGIGKTRFSA